MKWTKHSFIIQEKRLRKNIFVYFFNIYDEMRKIFYYNFFEKELLKVHMSYINHNIPISLFRNGRYLFDDLSQQNASKIHKKQRPNELL